MGNFKSVPATEWQATCRKATKKMHSMELIASTCASTETVLIESSLLMAVNTLAAWSVVEGETQ